MHINGSLCLLWQSMDLMHNFFSKKSICVIFLLRTQLQRPNIQLTHTQLYDCSDSMCTKYNKMIYNSQRAYLLGCNVEFRC